MLTVILAAVLSLILGQGTAPALPAEIPLFPLARAQALVDRLAR